MIYRLTIDSSMAMFKHDQFSQLQHPVEFANKKMLVIKRQALADSMMKWTTTPLHTSLTNLPKELAKEASRLHKAILGYMQDRKYANPNALAFSVLEKGYVRFVIHRYCTTSLYV